jgi:two-component system response regulator HupR/HoxA
MIPIVVESRTLDDKQTAVCNRAAIAREFSVNTTTIPFGAVAPPRGAAICGTSLSLRLASLSARSMAVGERSERIAPRIPVFSPIIASGIQRCWMTNISAGGMGLTGLFETASVPQRGDDLEVEFGLGSHSPLIRAVARVAWTSRLHSGGRLGFGVQFRELSQHARAQLAMFLAEHRPRVIVAFAPPAERELVEDCLGTLQLELVDRLEELGPELLATSSSILLFADTVATVTAFLDAIHAASTHTRVGIELPLASITLVTAADSEELLPLFSSEKIYEVLRPPVDRAAYVRAAQRSCERWALKLELRWASLQLEGLASIPVRPKPSSLPPVVRSSLIHVSEPMQRVYKLIQTVAVHDVPVLLTGETGTGKELAAREIHALSRRADTPFIAQDCGALTETLLESELFGHVRGAFTGATTDHPGLFQIADGGTIFLDEIQNTSAGLQAKLLRVVQEGEVRPVGGAKPRRVDVRLIAACNVDLKEAVAQRLFRADFYYRLNRFPIAIPPLREHPEDILPLVRYFVETLCESLDRPIQRIEPRVEAALRAYAWPGNIRELKNAIERALLLTRPDEPLRWDTLPEEIRTGATPTRDEGTGFEARVADFERELIVAALERNGGVVRRAARDLDVNAVTLARKMRKLGLE